MTVKKRNSNHIQINDNDVRIYTKDNISSNKLVEVDSDTKDRKLSQPIMIGGSGFDLQKNKNVYKMPTEKIDIHHHNRRNESEISKTESKEEEVK